MRILIIFAALLVVALLVGCRKTDPMPNAGGEAEAQKSVLDVACEKKCLDNNYSWSRFLNHTDPMRCMCRKPGNLTFYNVSEIV